MPSFAMGFGLLPFSISQTTYRKAIQNPKFPIKKHSVQRISFVESGQQSVDVDAGFFRPLPRSQRNAIVCNSDIGFSVVRLFFTGRPSAIFWAIRTVVINPIKRCSRRSFAHVLNKICKRRPSFANVNSSRTVPFVSGAFGVVATLLNGLPNSVQIGLRLTMTALHDASVLQWSEKVK
jgi:hypothetical protein